MIQTSKAFPIDETGRVWITDAGDTALATAKFTVGTTPVELTTSSASRRKVFVRNFQANSEIIVYLGGDNQVSASNGFPLYGNDEIELDVDENAEVWAVAASSGAEVYLLEVR